MVIFSEKVTLFILSPFIFFPIGVDHISKSYLTKRNKKEFMQVIIMIFGKEAGSIKYYSWGLLLGLHSSYNMS